MRQSQEHSLVLLNLKGLSFFKSLPLMDLGRGSVKSHPAFLQHSAHIHWELSSRGVQYWASLASACVLGQLSWGCHSWAKPRLWNFWNSSTAHPYSSHLQTKGRTAFLETRRKRNFSFCMYSILFRSLSLSSSRIYGVYVSYKKQWDAIYASSMVVNHKFLSLPWIRLG